MIDPEELIDHLIEGHQESGRDLILWLIDDARNHPHLTVLESLEHLHTVQHDSEDYEVDHDHMIYDRRFRS